MIKIYSLNANKFSSLSSASPKSMRFVSMFHWLRDWYVSLRLLCKYCVENLMNSARITFSVAIMCNFVFLDIFSVVFHWKEKIFFIICVLFVLSPTTRWNSFNSVDYSSSPFCFGVLCMHTKHDERTNERVMVLWDYKVEGKTSIECENNEKRTKNSENNPREGISMRAY